SHMRLLGQRSSPMPASAARIAQRPTFQDTRQRSAQASRSALLPEGCEGRHGGAYGLARCGLMCHRGSRPAHPVDEPLMTSLRRTLGLWQVSISGIGIILGAGVYALVGPAAGLAGNALWAAFL